MQSSRKMVVLGIAMSTLLLACSQQAGDQASKAAASAAVEAGARNRAAEPAMAPAAAPLAADAQKASDGNRSGATSPTPAMMGGRIGESSDPARRFVVTADARFRVKDVYATVTAIEDAVAAEQGFIVENKISAETGRERERAMPNARKLQLAEVTTSGELVVRVPAARTGAFLRGLAQHMAFLDRRDISARDVQFDILRKQLEARRQAALARSLGGMGGEPGRVADKVDATTAGTDAQAGSDEAAVAQRELEDSIAFSTIRVSLYQAPVLRSLEVPDVDAQMRAQSPGFFARMGEALLSGWRVMLEGVVALTAAWPLWVVLAGVVWVVRKWRGGRRQPQRQAEPSHDTSAD